MAEGWVKLHRKIMKNWLYQDPRVFSRFEAWIYLILSVNHKGNKFTLDNRPQLGDLRESGAIEQDADIVLLLYRDEYYNPDSSEKGIARCIIAKNRNGEVGGKQLGWSGQYQKFVDIAKKDYV